MPLVVERGLHGVEQVGVNNRLVLPRIGAPAVADYARSLQGRFFDLKPAQLDRLTRAIRHHSGGEVSTDATIQSCWDADRLDLGRVGITPDARFLSSDGAQHIKTAYAWSIGENPGRRRRRNRAGK